MADPRASESVDVPAATYGEAVDLARGFVACWTHDGPLDAVREWARQLHEELTEVLREHS